MIAIVKRYVNETGSNFVETLTDLKNGHLILVARITRVEVAAAFARRLKNRTMSATDVRNVTAAFESDLTNHYFTVEITPAILSFASTLASKHFLRGYDAIQLSAALEANDEGIANGLSSLTLVSADMDLNTAAKSEGLIVENPNDHV